MINFVRLFGMLMLLALILYSQPSTACEIIGSATKQLDDPLYRMLENSDCPKDVIEFRARLQHRGAQIYTNMVANRGFHNPALGSFSFFETIRIDQDKEKVERDELYFGHFTSLENQQLHLDQNAFSPSLMIEIIAWDRIKEVYNFYELIGSQQGPKWFYRGDSFDIWNDTAKLYRDRTPTEPIFGSQLRCSGCHLSGGPIMKELSAPHDSWWRSDRHLPLGSTQADTHVADIMRNLRDPKELRSDVLSGLRRLINAKGFQKKIAISPQVALRPLFCSEEVNLQSSQTPLESGLETLDTPLNFFVDERLSSDRSPLLFSKIDYTTVLQNLGSEFPEIRTLDSDHPWLSPVKASSDSMAISKLISDQTIDEHFVLAGLAVDMTRPVFSKKRCQLLKLVPDVWSNRWQQEFKDKLSKSEWPSAAELLENLQLDDDALKARANRYLSACSHRLKSPTGVASLVKYLDQARREISASDISKNPLGQILEPGFRVIFPILRRSIEVPWRTTLNETTCMAE